MFDSDMINRWAYSKPVEEYYPLGNEKFLKLLDFISTLKVCEMLTEKRIPYDENFFERARIWKHRFEVEHGEILSADKRFACQVYTYYKQIIDSQDKFPIDGFVAEQETPIPDRGVFFIENKPKKIKKSKRFNVYSFCDHKRDKAV